LDYTVVIAVRQRFGDGNIEDALLETDAPFVGREKSYAFDCAGVDSSQSAIMLFQSQGVGRTQTLEVNGQTVFGGIPASPGFVAFQGAGGGVGNFPVASWNGNVMLLNPGMLQAQGNSLRIASTTTVGGDLVDNFIIDNLVIIYKTIARGGSGGSTFPGAHDKL